MLVSEMVVDKRASLLQGEFSRVCDLDDRGLKVQCEHVSYTST